MQREDMKDLLWFLEAAREQSFTKAAAALGTSQSTLSYTIKQLEARLGVRLLTRTTRSVATTEAGERLFQSLAPRFQQIEADLAALVAFREKPSGTVRLTLSDHALQTTVWPKLSRVLSDYPDIRLELYSDNGMRNIVEERFDAGVRLGESVDKDMIAVRISPDWRHRNTSPSMAFQPRRRIWLGMYASTCAKQHGAGSIHGSSRRTVVNCGSG